MEDITLKEYVKGRFDTQDKVLDEIKVVLAEHNGRLKKQEIWRAMLVGGWIVLTVIIIPVAVEILKK